MTRFEPPIPVAYYDANRHVPAKALLYALDGTGMAYVGDGRGFRWMDASELRPIAEVPR